MERKPERDAFYFTLAWFAIITLAVAGVATIFTTVQYAFGAWVVVNIIAYWFRTVMYDKEQYEIADDRIRRQAGTPFNDTTAELAIKKITNVRLKLPFFTHKLFGTGVIDVEAAGGGGTEIKLQDVAQPHQLFETIQDAMRDNGYSLSMDEQQYTTTPSRLGATLDALWRTGLTAVVIGVFAADLFTSITSLGTPLLTLAAAAFVTIFTWIYQNNVRRTYHIYEDTVRYEEGWFHRYETVLPMEKLSDSDTNQSVIKKLLGIYDVEIGTKGTANDVQFTNIRNGPELERVIDSSIADSTELDQYEQTKEGAASEAASRIEDVDTTTTMSFTPDGLRASLLFVTLLIIGIGVSTFFSDLAITVGILAGVFFGAVNPILTWLFTTYRLKEESVISEYDFLTTDHTEFGFAKVTGIVVKRNPLDHLLGTVTLNIWSIGGDQTLSLKYVKPEGDLIQQLLAKEGLSLQDEYDILDIDFNLAAFFSATLPIHILVLVGVGVTAMTFSYVSYVLIAVAAVYVATITYSAIYYNLAELRFYEDGVHCRKGVIFTKNYYTTLDDIKDVTSTRYPFMHTGWLTCNVAGETVVQGKNGKQRSSYGFSLGFIPAVRNVHATADHILWDRPEPPITVHNETNTFTVNGYPAVRNYFTFWGLLLPLAILLIWFIPFLLWARLVKSYHLDDNRAVARSGILYKQQTTLRYSKIDHIDTFTSFINKICGNSKITIQSTGSSSAEITMRDLDNAHEFKEELQRHY